MASLSVVLLEIVDSDGVVDDIPNAIIVIDEYEATAKTIITNDN
jgi:hypothetical protein